MVCGIVTYIDHCCYCCCCGAGAVDMSEASVVAIHNPHNLLVARAPHNLRVGWGGTQGFEDPLPPPLKVGLHRGNWPLEPRPLRAPPPPIFGTASLPPL
jgi:hypothetical protein